MQLFDHQKKFLAENPNKSALIWSCGCGKSLTAIEWSKLYDGNTLIVCPKPLKANWNRELQKWGGTGTVLTKEEFRRDHQTLPRYEQIIVDEIHNGWLTPNFKSQMSKSLRNYLKKHSVSRFLGLSATPYSSSPWNIFSLAYFLGYEWNYMTFKNAFFYEMRMGPRLIPVARKDAPPRLAQIVKRIASVVDINDIMDVPLQHHADPEYFALSPAQVKGIEETYDPLPIVRYTRQHEIENGVLIGDEFTKTKIFENDKTERIKALCEENPKLAIVCRYNAQIDYLKDVLKDYSPSVIRGDVKDRDAVCVAAEAAEKAVVLIQADCAEGYELPSFPLVVFASMSYSYVKWEQLSGRFLRMNKPSRTTFLYLLTEGDSVDQGVYNAIKRKEDFRVELFNGRRC